MILKIQKNYISRNTPRSVHAILQKTYDSKKQIKIYGYIEETLYCKK